MGGRNKLLVLLVVSKAGIRVVVVRDCIAVVTSAGLVVHKQRGAPDGCGAKVGHIIQVVCHALDIASVAGAGVLPVKGVQHERRLPGVSGAVFVGCFGTLPLCKPVRHDQVDHVRGGKALAGSTSGAALPYEIRVLEALPFPCENKVVGTGGRNFHVHKQKIRVIGLMDLFHLEALAGSAHFTGRNIRPLHHELEGRIHANPPAQGLYAGYFPGTGLRDIPGACSCGTCSK